MEYDPESEWLEISNLPKFTDYIRKMIYINFNEENAESDIQDCFQQLESEEKQEINEVLSLRECIEIVKENCKKFRHKKTKKLKYVIDSNAFDEILHKVNQRMISNIISALVSRGLLDSAFDEEKNDFVFWVAQQDNEKEE